MIAQPGYAFDFTGRLETTPDLSGVAGTSTPTISGTYLGNVNDTYTVTAVGSGQVGVTPGLKFEISDGDGNVIQEIEVGERYEAGSEIDIGDGIALAFDVGDVAQGDQFEIVRVANSDTTGILSSLGLNHFFNGTDASNIGVDSKFANNPNLIATSLSGELADTRNLSEFINLRDQAVFDGVLTFESFLSEMNTEIGFQVQTSQRIESSLSELKFQYETEREAISGVDVNEELIELTQHQKNYEAAIQVVRTMESMLDELFQIIR
jgi:flagellar hook-associated protein 1 FlgK